MNGIEDQFEEAVDFFQLNLFGPIGRQAAAMFGVRVVPTTLILDRNGSIIVRQVGIPDRATLKDALQHLA